MIGALAFAVCALCWCRKEVYTGHWASHPHACSHRINCNNISVSDWCTNFMSSVTWHKCVQQLNSYYHWNYDKYCCSLTCEH